MLEESKRLPIRSLPVENQRLMVRQHFAKAHVRKLSKSQNIPSTSNSSCASSVVSVPINSLQSIHSEPLAPSSSLISNLTGHRDKQSPEAFIYQLQEFTQKLSGQVSTVSALTQGPAIVKLLVALRVSLTSQTINWLQQFILSNGIPLLLDLLELIVIHQKQSATTKAEWEFNVEYELIKCLKALMNNQIGLSELIQLAPRSIQLMVHSCLQSTHFFARKLAAELLTVVCYTDGHMLVQSALESSNTAASHAQSPGSVVPTVLGYIHRVWMQTLDMVMQSRNRVGGGSSGGLVAGVGWVGDNRVTEKDIIDYLVQF